MHWAGLQMQRLHQTAANKPAPVRIDPQRKAPCGLCHARPHKHAVTAECGGQLDMRRSRRGKTKRKREKHRTPPLLGIFHTPA